MNALALLSRVLAATLALPGIVRPGLDQDDRTWAASDQGEFLRLVGEARLPASAR